MEKKNELENFSIRNEMAEKSYQEMIMLYQQRDRIYHDMKNHIAVLSALNIIYQLPVYSIDKIGRVIDICHKQE